MSQLFSFLDTEVTKFRDIENILKKLKQDGEIDSIFDVLKGVFSNEFKFTTQELLRIESEKGEKLNIQEQCQDNMMMFKSNFQLIVQMIFDKAFKSAASENKVKLAEKEGLTPAETTMESANASTISEEVSTKKKKAKKARSKSKRAASPKHSESNISLDPRTPSRKNKTKAKKDSATTFTSPSRATSPLAKIFGTSASTRAGDSFKERASRRSSPHPNQSQSQMSQSQSQINISESYMSEFNHIRGPATFKRSPRASTSRNVSPGPGTYKNEPTSLRQSPSPTIDRATKKCWFDEIAQQNESPGPAKHFGAHYYLSK